MAKSKIVKGRKVLVECFKIIIKIMVNIIIVMMIALKVE